MLDNKELEIKVRQNMAYCEFVYKTTACSLYMRLAPAIPSDTPMASEFSSLLARMSDIAGILKIIRGYLNEDKRVSQSDIQPYLDRLFDYSKAYEDMLALEDKLLTAIALNKLFNL